MDNHSSTPHFRLCIIFGDKAVDKRWYYNTRRVIEKYRMLLLLHWPTSPYNPSKSVYRSLASHTREEEGAT